MSEQMTGQNAGRWMYRSTWVRDNGTDEDQKLVQKVFDTYSSAGWELVSANAVAVVLIKTEYTENVTSPYFGPYTFGTSVIRHYMYWRKLADGPDDDG